MIENDVISEIYQDDIISSKAYQDIEIAEVQPQEEASKKSLFPMRLAVLIYGILMSAITWVCASGGNWQMLIAAGMPVTFGFFIIIKDDGENQRKQSQYDEILEPEV